MKIKIDRDVSKTLYYTGDVTIVDDSYGFAISVFVVPTRGSKDKLTIRWTLDDVIWKTLPPVMLVKKAQQRISSLVTKIMEDLHE